MVQDVRAPECGPRHDDEPHEGPEPAVEGCAQVVCQHEEDKEDKSGTDGEGEGKGGRYLHESYSCPK